MMRLTVLKHGSLAVQPPQSVLFEPPGATIGRGTDNHLVLLDETRQISRLQASLRIDASGAYLKNLSSVCRIDINDCSLPSNEEQRLQAGDLISIGIYLLRAENPEQAMQAAEIVTTPIAVDTAPPAPLPSTPPVSARPDTMPATAPLADLLPDQGATSTGSFLDLFAEPPAAAVHAPTQSSHLPGPLHATPAEPATPPQVPLPASVVPSQTAATLPPAAFWDSLVAEFAPDTTAPAQFDRNDQVHAPLTVAAPAPQPALATEPALAQLQGLPLDPLDLFAAQPGTQESALFSDDAGVHTELGQDPLGLATMNAVTPIQAQNTHEIAGHFSAPRLTEPAPEHQAVSHTSSQGIAAPQETPPLVAAAVTHAKAAPKPEAPLTPSFAGTASATAPHLPASTTVADAALLWRAFAEGAGLELDERITPAQCQQAGRMLSGMLAGTMELLASRTIIKREVKADLTMLLDRENNPLKLLPDAQTVLKQMFGPPFPGFMSPEQALADAFNDLHAHQLGMLAGMRAALSQLLKDVSPEQIGVQATQGGWHTKLLPYRQGHQAWLHYRRLHQTMLHAVEDDFHRVFGNAFLAAYDAEIEHYRHQRKGASAC
ncbi:FHA domain protein [Andreprevotia lacus DSM 23236]|jgi:FHA domain-containing protein|uniref:FHA domain protein n=1 Tax=Andreprevotia lacus DSM 23236 TaxID=1121001 RepID=A0A1W1Y047_9NEIS|nr:type VI secretion system-associated FHA domain protein TagH [Andreprevotia lacus]SMC29533.1 FHA domain protein [Andreprevotia lacus DSM 23236]